MTPIKAAILSLTLCGALAAPATVYAGSGGNGGKWNGGKWNGGKWNGGKWNGGKWNGGKWNGGKWNTGLWQTSSLNDGRFSVANWQVKHQIGRFTSAVWRSISEVAVEGSRLIAYDTSGTRLGAVKSAKWTVTSLRTMYEFQLTERNHPEDNTMKGSDQPFTSFAMSFTPLKDNSDVWQYRIRFRRVGALGWENLCESQYTDSDTGQTGIFLEGTWDQTQNQITDENLTFACQDSVPNKCARIWGYKTWKTVTKNLPSSTSTSLTYSRTAMFPTTIQLRPLHTACVRAVSATYCDELSVPFTGPGHIIDIVDSFGLNVQSTPDELQAVIDDWHACGADSLMCPAYAPSPTFTPNNRNDYFDIEGLFSEAPGAVAAHHQRLGYTEVIPEDVTELEFWYDLDEDNYLEAPDELICTIDYHDDLDAIFDQAVASRTPMISVASWVGGWPPFVLDFDLPHDGKEILDQLNP